MKERDNEPEARKLTEREQEELNREQESELIMDAFGVSDSFPKSGLDFGSPSTRQDFIDLSTKLVAKFKDLAVRSLLVRYIPYRLPRIIPHSPRTLFDKSQ